MTPAKTPKEKLRGDIFDALASLSTAYRDQASSTICTDVEHNPIMAQAKCVLGFAPMSSEPDITRLLETLRADGTLVVLPKACPETRQMELIELRGPLAELPKDTLGVRVPSEGPAVPIDQVDVALVPGVAFDHLGNRLGRGGGFYDRFLASASELKTIGLCFDLQLVDKIPSEPHDIRVDDVSTERRHLADLSNK